MELGQDYVNFIVFKEILGACICITIFVISFVISITGFLKAKGKESFAIVVAVVFSVIATIMFVSSIIRTYEAWIANTYPLMYTIEHLTK